MNRKFAIFFSLLVISSSLFADEEEESIEALRSWIASKRQVTVRELGGALALSGDIHVEYIALNESKNGIKNIGPHSLNPLIPNNQFDIEFNFMLDYRTDTNWAAVKVEFDNNMGVFGGTFNRLTLERAFFGFRLAEGPTYTLDMELGRRRLDYTFDSRIEFGAFMDGMLIKLNKSADKWGDFYLYGGPFVVNETVDHYSYVFEAGVLNLYNSGVYFKYSLIDWNTHRYHNRILRALFRFCNSQFLLGIKFVPFCFNKVVVLYGAFLINTAAQPLRILKNELQNKAGYVGFTIGELRKKGDWTFDNNFQYVQYYAVPDFDFNGIGKGNSDGIGLLSIRGFDGSGPPTTIADAVGKSGFYGWQALFLYLVKDNITISQAFKISHSIPHPLPTQYFFKAYRLEVIYAW